MAGCIYVPFMFWILPGVLSGVPGSVNPWIWPQIYWLVVVALYLLQLVIVLPFMRDSDDDKYLIANTSYKRTSGISIRQQYEMVPVEQDSQAAVQVDDDNIYGTLEHSPQKNLYDRISLDERENLTKSGEFLNDFLQESTNCNDDRVSDSDQEQNLDIKFKYSGDDTSSGSKIDIDDDDKDIDNEKTALVIETIECVVHNGDKTDSTDCLVQQSSLSGSIEANQNDTIFLDSENKKLNEDSSYSSDDSRSFESASKSPVQIQQSPVTHLEQLPTQSPSLVALESDIEGVSGKKVPPPLQFNRQTSKQNELYLAPTSLSPRHSNVNMVFLYLGSEQEVEKDNMKK